MSDAQSETSKAMDPVCAEGATVSDTRPKLGKALREMLERIGEMGDKGLMQLQITANGRSEFNKMKKLVDLGCAEVCEIRLSREMVPGVRITEDGKRALS